MNIRNQIKNPIVFNLMNNNNSISNNSYKDTTSDTTLSRTSENLTQIFNSNSSKTTTKIPIEMLTKSMQTSTSAFVNTATAVAAANTKEKYRIVPPSFLAQLNKLGDEQKAPVFVIYPNYALPDLGFLKQQQQPPDQVILSPLSFKEPFSLKNRKAQQTSILDGRPLLHRKVLAIRWERT
jgi:iporin